MRRHPALILERLESRDLPSTVLIDSTMIQQAAGGPILLSQPSTTYVLTQNLDVAGTAFEVGAANVTLNLNGYTVTYGDSPALTVTNGGFEQGKTGWNLSAASAASIVPSITGMYGQSMLQLANISSTQTLISSPVSISTANHEYAAAITPYGTYGATVQLSVIDAATGAVLGSGTSNGVQRGFAALVTFTPTTTHSILLRIDVTPPSGQTATIDLDYAAVMPSRDYGVIATTTWSGEWPSQLQTSAFEAIARYATNFTVENGHLIQGGGRGYSSSPLFFQGLSGFTVSGVDAYADGMDTNVIDGTWGANGTVQNSTIRASIDRISDRMGDFAGVELANFAGTASVTGNQITGVPQIGVMFNGMPGMTSLTINNNTIQQAGIVTDDYGITVAGAQNFEIAGNHITPTNGRGILLDGWGRIPTTNGTVHDNYVSVIEKPNLEYSQAETTALRIRNYESTQASLKIYNNTFIATTGPGYFDDAIAARISEWNDAGQSNNADNIFQNNLFKAVVTTTDTSYSGQALSISGVGPGSGMLFLHNTLESNDTSLNLGDNDSWQENNDDITFMGNWLKRSSDGAVRAYSPIVAGTYENEVSRIRLYNTRLLNGATFSINYQWTVTPASFQIGWQLIASGADSGGVPEVKVFDGPYGSPAFDFNAYASTFAGGVRVATGDVTGDGVPDIVTAAGAQGGSIINVYEGNTGSLIKSFSAFGNNYGTYVAVADVNGDGRADIIVSQDQGGSNQVRIYSGLNYSLLRSFNPYAAKYKGGIRVAAAGNRIATAPASNANSTVALFDGSTGKLISQWTAYSSRLSGGIYVAMGDVNGDGKVDIITGAGAGGLPEVKVFSGTDFALLSDFYAYSISYTGGVRVGVMTDLASPGHVDILTGHGQITSSNASPAIVSSGLPVQVFDGMSKTVLDSFFAYSSLGQGVFIGGS